MINGIIRGATHMRKWKCTAINSYAQYQKRKVRETNYKIMGFIALLIIGTFLMTGRFRQDLEEVLLLLHLKVPTIEQDVYLKAPSIDYLEYSAPEVARGIYIPTSKLKNYEDYIKLAKKTRVNSFVIDVKDDMGYLTFTTDNETLKQAGMVLAKPPIEHMDEVMSKIYEAGIYPIARVVAFKDNVLAASQPERAVKSLDGSIYTTSSNDTWLNPYNKGNWKYLLEVSKEAARQGFKEIQFDYVRFHETMNASRVLLDEDKSKTEIITEFTKYICGELQKEGIKVSADVFGAVVLSDIDAEIVGQDFKEMSKYLDYICPMVYPSHYANGTFGIEYPHINVYEIIYRTMKLGKSKLENEQGQMKAVIRPWLQDFTIKNKEPYWEYGPEEIEKQIKGAEAAGVEEWLFWNAAGRYTEEGLKAK